LRLSYSKPCLQWEVSTLVRHNRMVHLNLNMQHLDAAFIMSAQTILGCLQICMVIGSHPTSLIWKKSAFAQCFFFHIKEAECNLYMTFSMYSNHTPKCNIYGCDFKIFFYNIHVLLVTHAIMQLSVVLWRHIIKRHGELE
jgi:hypothetical protein